MSWASLSEPHTTAHARGKLVCFLLFTRVCRTLVPEIRVRPDILRVFRYIDVLELTCVIYNCMYSEIAFN